jgi:hypothetical protein
MRQAFAACVAFVVLVVIVVARFGCKDSSPEVPAHPIVDAAIADAPPADAALVLDAAPTPKKPAPKPTPKKPSPKKPTPKPTPAIPTPVIPTPVIPTPVIPTPVRPRCTQPPNPAGCPAAEPNVNRPCDAEGAHCVYGTSCCPPVYVCNGGVFEARFSHCN